MKIKAALLDFDGTLVTKDILDVLTAKVGKEIESKQINEALHRGELQGLTALITRINFLKGMTEPEIFAALQPESYLMPGAKALMDFFKRHQIVTILASGNILPVLRYYQQLLSIDYIIGAQPQMDGETIVGIDESAFSSSSFKLDGIKKILNQLNISVANVVALGDSPSDKGLFESSSYSIAVNPKGNIGTFAHVVIGANLNEAVKLLESISTE